MIRQHPRAALPNAGRAPRATPRSTTSSTKHADRVATHSLCAIALACSAAFGMATAPEYASAQNAPLPTTTMSVALPEQPLAQTLNALSRQSGVAIGADGALLAGRTAPPLQGSLTLQQALDTALRGSGLVPVRSGPGTITIQRQAAGSAAISTLPAVSVTADAIASGLPAPYAGGQVARGSRLGILGNKDMLDTPFSATQYTSQLIEDQQAQNLGDILVNDPAIRNTYSRDAGRDEFNIRGFTLFNYDISFNGLYGMSPRDSSSLIGVERVDVLRGPNALLNGMAPAGSVGGAINLVPKRAGPEPLNRVTLSYMEGGQFGTHVDLARRFGENKEWGVRLNAIRRSGDTPVDHSSAALSAVALGVDYQGDKVRLEADVNYQKRRTGARSGLLLPDSGVAIGRAPDNKTNFLPDWTYWDVKELAATMRGEIDLSPNLTAYGAAGAMNYDFTSLQTSFLLQDPAGSLIGRPVRLNQYVDTRTAEGGVRGKFATGGLQHVAVASVSTLTMNSGSRRQNGSVISSNLYSPVFNARPEIAIADGVPKTGQTRLNSIALADTISMADQRLQLTLGARRQQVESSNFDAVTGNRIDPSYKKSAITPVAALVFKVTPVLSVYGNYIEGLTQGPTAPADAINANQMFPPSKAKQMEVGTKYDFGRFAATFSAFQFERANGYRNPATNVFGVDGQQRNRGLELVTQGEVATGVRLLAGAAFTDGKLTRTEGGLNDGRNAPAVPRFQFNAAAEWDTPFLVGLTLTTRAVRTSSQFVDTENVQQIPGWTRFDVGARYRFVAGKTPITIRAAIENVADKNYWQSAARQGLTIGAPRTLLLSVSADI